MAAHTSGISLLGAMDSLWFHQIIFLSQHSLLLTPETSETVPMSLSETSDASSRNTSQMSMISQQENSDESSSEESDKDEEDTSRPTQPYLVPSKSRCHSSSPISAKTESRKRQYSRYHTRKLPKTRSCKSLMELELEEVKGFMDLGFTFSKENFTNRLMKLLPGLQRIDANKNEDKNPKITEFTNNTHNSKHEERDCVARPYLSEAWFTKLSYSPLPKLTTPRSATASAVDMKQQLKDWARTVALIIQQEEP